MAQLKATLDTYLHLASTLGTPPELSELHADIMLPASEHGWAVYYSDADIREVVDLYLAKYQQYLDGLNLPASAPSPPVTTAAMSAAKRKRTASTKKLTAATLKAGSSASAAAKSASATSVSSNPAPRPTPKEVEEISAATRLIKRFCGVVNREVELAALIRLLKALQQAILKKLVRATSAFAPELREIQSALVDIANKAKPGQVRLDVPDEKLAVYLSIAGGEAVFESVRLLSRYIRQQGLEPSDKWVKSWRNAVTRFLQSAKAATDPLAGHLAQAVEDVGRYKQSGRIGSSSLDLRGLSGLFGLGGLDHAAGDLGGSCISGLGGSAASGADLAGLGCTPGNPCKSICKAKRSKKGRNAGSASGLGELEAELVLMKSAQTPDQRPEYAYVPAGHALEAGKHGGHGMTTGLGSLDSTAQAGKRARKGQPLMSGSDLMSVSYSTYAFSEPIATLTGRVARGFLAMLHGLPGQGKSTFALQWAVDAARLGPVLYVSSEEHGSYTLKDKLSRAGGPVAGMDFAGSLSDADLGKYRFLFVDSVNHAGMEIETLRQIKAQYPNLSIVLVMQSTKEGQFKGSQEWAHETDIVITLEGGKARTEKNRYAPLSQIKVF